MLFIKSIFAEITKTPPNENQVDTQIKTKKIEELINQINEQ